MQIGFNFTKSALHRLKKHVLLTEIEMSRLPTKV